MKQMIRRLMSQHKTKYNTVFSIILTAMAVAMSLVSCQDDIQYRIVEIPDAEVDLQGEIIYRPLISTEVTTRAEAPEGENYNGINSLHVYFFDEEKNKISLYSGDIKKENWTEEEFKENTPDGATHKHLTFKKRVKAGKYYVFAITNIEANQVSELSNVKTIDELRQLKLVWNDDINKDLEMFGVFKANEHTATPPDNESFEENDLLTITPSINRIYSWVRRAASKVTVDFNGSGLKEGVTVYIQKATLKDVASGAFLGAKSMVDTPNTSSSDNTETRTNGFKCTTSNYTLTYGNGELYTAWPTVTKTGSFTPSIWGEEISYTSFHDDKAKALPCYENMQGEPLPEGQSKLQDSNGDGIIDSYEKDNVVYGTYLEVEGYYVADRPEYKSEGPIKYRFMLGKDEIKNFDLVRNHHYKITMNFKGYGNDIDWHIEYNEKYLDVTYPEDVNYQGKFFVPSQDYSNTPNAGHDFSDQNVITITSFSTDGDRKTWKEPEITYDYYSYNNETGSWVLESNPTVKWLSYEIGELSDDNSQTQYTFKAAASTPIETSINSLFPNTGQGSQNAPYNLSNETGKSEVENTANSYIVDAPGWYCFPLVYGNAIKDKVANPDAYPYNPNNPDIEDYFKTEGASEPDDESQTGNNNQSDVEYNHFVTHLGKRITTPYIVDNEGIKLTDNEGKVLSNISVKLIWQDAENLVDKANIQYDPTLFNGKGGIKFKIGTMAEGNAIIALIDNSLTDEIEDKFVNINRQTYGQTGSTKAIWSWHIWATRFGSGDFENNISILDENENSHDVLPVHLGWCAGGNIKYYPRRKCDIKFKVENMEIVRTIEQYPHFVLPRGDHPYYQWGRKDPFVGTNLAFGNKKRWTQDAEYDVWSDYNPPRMFTDQEKDAEGLLLDWTKDKRKHSKNCIHWLVRNPDKWLNAPRYSPETGVVQTNNFSSKNKSYPDLWSNNGKKTVYDPCPPGYKVGSEKVFSGFVIKGGEKEGLNWFDVHEKNMNDFYNFPATNDVNSKVLEVYTDTRKLQSLLFPVTGYRDYDAKGGVNSYHDGSFNGVGYVWTNHAADKTNSYQFRFEKANLTDLTDLDSDEWKSRGNMLNPADNFYNCNGYGVRPVVDK